ncbi:NLI interacting factor-like phosphatase-domain-containing protein [Armillaria novae-zelandiae]|uniref:Mitochondrial import inner membrane translocase subunit TIM50 n=1 Tax=Armillaria novae-zelandiae TaxID=153914 RepID=A0AA39UC15_9AGAR|nr:NLI interacting factor-like phosphatase-domain-containing protein [Armillaria novae-zelandiae]
MTTVTKRKLLVLDLNGALLFRPKHKRTKTCHPRPYLSTFTSFLFHPATRQWLDTMVWSSAQPKNVGWMVERAFGQHVDKLKLVWTRDQMGLSKAEYGRKTQTTKDLSHVWKSLDDFSGKNTILLDDSPSKARLQPYNHICVEEYTCSTRGAAVKGDDLVPKMDSLSLGVDDDETLLAVIGILDCIKSEGDVAKWMKGGGLSGKTTEVSQWYTNPDILRDWARLGKKALDALPQVESVTV